jgi:FkbM family methyltransferase
MGGSARYQLTTLLNREAEMGHKGINYAAKFTKSMVDNRAFKENPLIVVDVGARGGFADYWSIFADQINCIGFEPDAKECDLINNSPSNLNKRVYPFALHKTKGTYPFYITKFPNSSGFYETDMSIAKRFPIWEPLAVEAVKELNAIDFDSFASENNIECVDFVKLDTEGSELDILEGAIKTLRKSVMGISCEAMFTPWHKDQKVFADLDLFLRSQGFELYDMPTHKFSRKSLPDFRNAINSTTAVANYGQVMFSDVLYFRDPIKEIESGVTLEDPWDEQKILKLVSLYEIFNLPDCAIELLQYAQKKGLISYSEKQTNSFCDLIVSGFAGGTYKEYFEKFEIIRERGYISNPQRIKLFLLKLSYYFKRLFLEKHKPSWYRRQFKKIWTRG